MLIKLTTPQHRAMEDETNVKSEHDYLTYGSSLSQRFVHFNPKETAVLGLTAMIKVLAQMKNLRRGHDAQGRLKKIKIDESYEGYANFMAPLRMKKIAYDVEQAKEEARNAEKMAEKAKMTIREAKKWADDLAKVFDTRILKPSTETFLTPEWDEMVPFPTSKLSISSTVAPHLSLISSPPQHGKSASTATVPAITVRISPCSAKMTSRTISRRSTSRGARAITAARLLMWLVATCRRMRWR